MRSLAYTPLFQVLFAWQNASDGTLELPGLTVGDADGAARDTAKFDLSLALWETGGRIAGGLTYATALFDAATVERFAGYLRRVLQGMVADEARRVDALPMLPAAERARVLDEWNDTDAGYPRGACVHELFARRRRARRTPPPSWRGETRTYGELDARANRIAHARAGAAWGRSRAWASACRARRSSWPPCWACWQPVARTCRWTPRTPASGWATCWRTRGCPRPHGVGARGPAAPGAAACCALDAERDALAAEPAGAPESGATAENLSHVIFTSGSTGRPKGVMIRHASVVVLLHWLRENVTDEERASVLFATSITSTCPWPRCSARCAGAARWCWRRTRWSSPGCASGRRLRQHGAHVPRPSCCTAAASRPACGR